ncbi:hypothetical protein ACMFMF_011945 [Clarireedia jacksonii]
MFPWCTTLYNCLPGRYLHWSFFSSRVYHHGPDITCFTNLATSPLSTFFSPRTSGAKSLFRTSPICIFAPSAFIESTSVLIVLLISSSPIVSTPLAYSSIILTCISSFSARSSLPCPLNSSLAARPAFADFRMRANICMSVLIGEEVLDALSV